VSIPICRSSPIKLPPWRVRCSPLSRVWIALFLLVIVGYFLGRHAGHAFFQAGQLQDDRARHSEVILLAVGQTFVIVTAGIDLSVGGILVFSGVAGGLTMLNQSGRRRRRTPSSTARRLGRAARHRVSARGSAGDLQRDHHRQAEDAAVIVTLGTLGITFGAADLLAGGTTCRPSRRVSRTTSATASSRIYVPVLIAARPRASPRSPDGPPCRPLHAAVSASVIAGRRAAAAISTGT